MVTTQFNSDKNSKKTSLVLQAVLLSLLLIFPLSVFSQASFDQLDGVVNQNEIAGMTSIGGTESATFYIQKEEGSLKLSIKSEPLYVANICIAQKESITVFHASAALGAIEYKLLNGNWTTNEEFNWEMRTGDMTTEALQQRQQYFEKNNWIATTTGMGTSAETEFLFKTDVFDQEPIYIAAGLMLASNPDSIASFPENSAGACADHGLVAGSPDTEYTFDYSSWFEITL